MEETVETQAEETVQTVEPTSLDALFSSEAPKQEVSPVVETSPVSEPETPEAEPEKVETPSTETPAEKSAEVVKAEYEARLKETRDWTTRVNSENAQLKRDLAEQNRTLVMINKKLDGEWTEEDERAIVPSQQPTSEQFEQNGHIRGKIDASREAAYDIYGKEEVEKTLFADTAPFREIMEDPIVKAKVLSSNAPVIEAMKIIKVKQFYDKWGYEPKDIEKNMRETIEKELRDKITQDVLKKMQGKDKVTTGIRDVRSSDRTEGVITHTPLKDIFG
jgi:hypothetical protein